LIARVARQFVTVLKDTLDPRVSLELVMESVADAVALRTAVVKAIRRRDRGTCGKLLHRSG
jgi:DhnA family fructose-bisphosphate aldolase class Ia